MILRWIALFLLCHCALGGAAQQEIAKERMLQDLTLIQHVFTVQYAPTQWKQQHWGLNIEALFAEARADVKKSKNITTKDFQHLLRRVFNCIADYHVGVQFYSTESASLPFLVRSTEGTKRQYFVVSSSLDTIHVGDELSAWDNKPIDEVVQAMKSRLRVNKNRSATDQAMVELMLTQRFAAVGVEVPRGEVSLSLIKPNGLRYDTTLEWDYAQEQVPDFARIGLTKTPQAVVPLAALASPPLPTWKRPQMMMAPFPMVGDTQTLGTRESYLPQLGKPIWRSHADAPFDAYICRTPQGHRIGYIRIPHYAGDEEEVNAFADILEPMQQTCEALIIDQLNNPGGSLFYLYGLLSTLTKQPLVVPKHHVALTQGEVYTAISALRELQDVNSLEQAQAVIGTTLGGYTLTYDMVEQLRLYHRSIVSAWQSGRLLTDPLPLFGVEQIKPHPRVQWDKPLFVLINELDFSAGDFLPAILQDNQRAILVGTATAGAGGYVSEVSYPNHSGIVRFTYTASVAQREDATMIENVGVTPDIVIPLTADDLRYNYRDYLQRLLVLIDTYCEAQ